MTKKALKKRGVQHGKKESDSESQDPIRDLEDLKHDELSGSTDHSISTATSSTDEDEDEGLGDGNIGRSKDDILGK